MLTPMAAHAETARATLTWNTATDIDLHIWDAQGNHAWYGDPTGIPNAVLSADETAGFGPETFTETANEGRAYVFCVHYYSGTGTTTTTLDVTDPGGDQRILAESLAAAGDGRFVTDSPVGSNPFDPPSELCGPSREVRGNEVTACDRDAKSYYVKQKNGAKRMKITQVAKTCVKHVYRSDGTSCAVVTSHDSRITKSEAGAGQSYTSVKKFKPTKTLTNWRKTPIFPNTVNTNCSLLSDDDLYRKTDYFDGKYRYGGIFNRRTATPKLSVRIWAGDTNDMETIPADMREALTQIRKVSGWTFK